MDSVDYYLIQNAKEKIKTMQNEDIKFCDYIKLKKQLEKIEKAMVSDYFSCNILLKKEPYKFDLFNCECSTGKTFSVVTKVVLFLEKWAIDIYNPKGMLFVMQNIAPCKYYANKINEELFDNNIIAETVDSDMDDVEIKNKLNRYPVIFLTHEKYKVLAQDEEERKQFSKDRILLVIDEFINMCKKIWIDNIEYEDIRLVEAGDICPVCGKPLLVTKGIEVGNIFKLGTKYSKPMNAVFTDVNGEMKPYVMGCYGIGISRTAAAAVEAHYDEYGIKWPISIAPYHVVVIPVSTNDELQMTTATKIYEDLQKAGVEVVLDDRDERAGVKFKDADLIGFP